MSAVSLPRSLLAVDRSWEAALPRPALPGAFDWWYADARDDRGDGLVFIWASRLPFFDSDRPSLNLALYRGGRQEFWLLQQPERTAWSERAIEGGFEVALDGPDGPDGLDGRRSTLRLTKAGDGTLSLEVSLDLVLPSEARSLRGTLSLRGPSALLPGAPDPRVAAHPHRWVPLAPAARCSARLLLGSETLFHWDGPGYLDRNLGDAPLASLGLRRWEWGRARAADRCSAWYLLEGTDGSRQAVTLDASAGERPGCTIGEVPGFARDRGLLLPAGAALRIDPGAAVERGPFYTRSFGTVSGPGGLRAATIHERCEVARIGAAWHAPLVRMRLHRPSGDNSLFAPLFTGHRQGRLRRLLGLEGRA